MSDPSITVSIPSTFSIDVSKETTAHVKGMEYASATKSILLSIDNQAAIVELVRIGLKSIVAQYTKAFKPTDSTDLANMLAKITNAELLAYVTEEKQRGAKKSEYPQDARMADYKLVIALCAQAKQPINTLMINWAIASKAQTASLELAEQLYTKLVTLADKIETKYPAKFTEAVLACIRFADYLDTIIQVKKAMKPIELNESIDADAEIVME